MFNLVVILYHYHPLRERYFNISGFNLRIDLLVNIELSINQLGSGCPIAVADNHRAIIEALYANFSMRLICNFAMSRENIFNNVDGFIAVFTVRNADLTHY